MSEISLRRARTIIRKTLEHGREQGWGPLSAVVLDAGGNIQAFERGDGAAPGRFDIAYGKAYGAVMFGAPSSTLGDIAIDRPHFGTALTATFKGALIPVAGGVLIRDKKGAVIGAVGVTGDTSDNDAAAAMVAIESAGLIGDA